jgi:hypothetical protein
MEDFKVTGIRVREKNYLKSFFKKLLKFTDETCNKQGHRPKKQDPEPDPDLKQGP